MRIAIACTYDSITEKTQVYTESDAEQLIDDLHFASLVVGFNIKDFDYEVLSLYHQGGHPQGIRTFDMMRHVYHYLGYRVSLDNLVRTTLGENKTSDGLEAVRLWKAGETEKVIEYCKNDVRITRELFKHGCQNGTILFTDRDGQEVSINTSKWEDETRKLLSLASYTRK